MFGFLLLVLSVLSSFVPSPGRPPVPVRPADPSACTRHGSRVPLELTDSCTPTLHGRRVSLGSSDYRAPLRHGHLVPLELTEYCAHSRHSRCEPPGFISAAAELVIACHSDFFVPLYHQDTTH